MTIQGVIKGTALRSDPRVHLVLIGRGGHYVLVHDGRTLERAHDRLHSAFEQYFELQREHFARGMDCVDVIETRHDPETGLTLVTRTRAGTRLPTDMSSAGFSAPASPSPVGPTTRA